MRSEGGGGDCNLTCMTKLDVCHLLTEYGADTSAQNRKFPAEWSLARHRSLEKLLTGWQDRVARFDTDQLDAEAWNDLVLLENAIAKAISHENAVFQRTNEALKAIPGHEIGIELLDSHSQFQWSSSREWAEKLNFWSTKIKASLESDHGFDGISRESAGRACRLIDSLLSGLESWNHFFGSYDPEFDWWISSPYLELRAKLETLQAALRTQVLKVRSDDGEAIIGEPVGRNELLKQLQFELVSYTPEELIAMGQAEAEWCRSHLEKAANELKVKDGMAAIQHVKTLHEPPGRQPYLVRDLANEAVEYLEANQLLTVPELAKSTWRMAMMPADKQKVNPFFLGGEQIIVSFPTSAMDHEFKMMSLKGNNRHFARATVQHELIPGHHIQQFMNSRHKTHRKCLWTPFWVEGWTLFWEMYLWDLGFPKSAEDRVGMLFWRLHRALRVVFSLKFHLGEMSADQCIAMLVEQGGHEPSNAEGEVRRSFSGAYPELYQAAYLIGGIQVRALGRELVASGWTMRQYLDRMISENQMPIEALRALLLNQKLPRPCVPSWRFER